MLEFKLQELIPRQISEFPKLIAGDPYYFVRWHSDLHGSLCLYYRFNSSDGVKILRKRVHLSEMRIALQHLRDYGTFDRSAYERICPKSSSSGPCGFTVLGRTFEALQIASYSGKKGFVLTDVTKATKLLEISPQ